MKIIDQTPLHDDKGQLSFIGRLQGTLKYGLNWTAELEAQKAVIAQFQRAFDKGYVLIRNFTLPNSEIVIPLILLAPSGVYVIHVTTVKGFFEAKGDQWNTMNNGASQPAPINLLTRVTRFARAVQIYLERINVDLKSPVEGVLIAFDPTAHVESVRPIVRVVQSDAIKQFCSTVLQARPVWRLDYAYGLGDVILDPTLPAERRPPPEIPQAAAERTHDLYDPTQPEADAYGFEEESTEEQTSQAPDAPQKKRAPAKKVPQKGKLMGLTVQQLALVGVMFICECIILLGAAYAVLFAQ
ncbi:MAG: NERD domain-containing protein [Anaerolineales bacterium]|nr:NERD domain-containing protein [Anaerolineales bacterium]